MGVVRFSHVGLCVRDLERARRFYVEGLGFRELSRLTVVGDEAARLLELARVALDAVYLERDGFRLELLHYGSPGSEAAGGVRPMNAAGLTHLSLAVDDLAHTLGQIAPLGAQVLAATRIESREHASRAIFVLDPDGTRIELVEGAFDPAQLPRRTP
jgi:catechol 2,3-dioxygenase-like lactoylglutathione lyase family enzyme